MENDNRNRVATAGIVVGLVVMDLAFVLFLLQGSPWGALQVVILAGLVVTNVCAVISLAQRRRP